MKVCGRVLNIRKTKNHIFLIISSKDKKQIQVVIDKGNFTEIKYNDIISIDGILDINNNSGESYIAKTVTKIGLSENRNPFNEKTLEIKSKISNNIRNFLNENGFIEMELPVLLFSENSSSAHSFVTKHNISDDSVYLRKNLDTMMRFIAANNVDKTFCLGHCFRNEQITSKREPEFEMLSIYANYYSLEDMIEYTKKLICNAFNSTIKYQQIKYEEFINLKEDKFEDTDIYVVTHYPKHNDSNAKISSDGNYMEEFKFVSKLGTLAHGVTEIDSWQEYINMCNRQEMQIFNGENLELYNSLRNGTAPCSSVGISINRLILELYPEVNGIQDLQAFPFSRVKRYKRNINIENNCNYELLSQYFSEKEIKKMYFKEPYIFSCDITHLKEVLQLFNDPSKYDINSIKLQIVQQPSKLRELLNTYELISKNTIKNKTQRERDIYEEI